MTEAKFTKGKWFIEKDASWNDDCWAISVKRDYDDSVHHCFAEVTYKMEHEESNPELEANAHLIAAAPEMYEMLKKMQAVMYHLSNEQGLIDSKRDACRDDFSTINGLLAKARGE